MIWRDYKMPKWSGSYLLHNGKMVAHITRTVGQPIHHFVNVPGEGIVRFHPAAQCVDLADARAAMERRVAALYPGAIPQGELEV